MLYKLASSLAPLCVGPHLGRTTSSGLMEELELGSSSSMEFSMIWLLVNTAIVLRHRPPLLVWRSDSAKVGSLTSPFPPPHVFRLPLSTLYRIFFVKNKNQIYFTFLEHGPFILNVNVPCFSMDVGVILH